MRFVGGGGEIGKIRGWESCYHIRACKNLGAKLLAWSRRRLLILIYFRYCIRIETTLLYYGDGRRNLNSLNTVVRAETAFVDCRPCPSVLFTVFVVRALRVFFFTSLELYPRIRSDCYIINGRGVAENGRHPVSTYQIDD